MCDVMKLLYHIQDPERMFVILFASRLFYAVIVKLLSKVGPQRILYVVEGQLANQLVFLYGHVVHFFMPNIIPLALIKIL